MKKIKIQLLSDLLCATGNSTAYIDADAKFDKWGLPYIPAKSFKGVLKEAAMEVAEITGLYDTQIGYLFGTDTIDGSINIRNVQIADYAKVCSELKNCGLLPKDCIHYFTIIRKQTALEEGIAKPTSLRTYRLIKKGIIEFETEIDYSPENEELMQRTLKQLRYIGLRRNRGFGKIKITEITDTGNPLSPEAGITNGSEITTTETAFNETKDTSLYQLNYVLTALDALHISRPVGDQNTESSEDFIPASAIRGIVAKSLIEKNNLGSNAHSNAEFKALILKEVEYANAYLCINNKRATPMPMAVAYDKTKPKKDRIATNILETDMESGKAYAKWNSDLYNPCENKEVELTHQFHHRRINARLAGKSTQDDGAIFYYESIEEGQQFKGYITGSKAYLETIKSILDSNRHAVGASKSTQYGNIEITCDDISKLSETNSYSCGYDYFLVLQSHAIFLNKNGYPEATPEVLKIYLKEIGLELIEDNYAAKTVRVESFYKPWNGNTDLEYAYAMGSTFKIKITGIDKLNQLKKLVFGERVIEGYGKFDLFEKLTEVKIAEDSKPNENKNDNKLGYEITNELLLKIRNKKKDAEHFENLKYKAFTEAQKPDYKNISNHQISRLRHILMNIKEDSPEAWYDHLVNIAHKSKLHEKLIASYEMGGVNSKDKLSSFGDYKNYWNQVLIYLRKKTKRSK